jgi:FlaA1/EpsC-like NDP-sugar epimerase
MLASEGLAVGPERPRGRARRHSSAFDLPPSDLAYLLGRAHTLSYSDGARALVEGKRFLSTGAGGSIGSEIVRQLYSLEPEAIFLLDRDESLMHAVQLNLHGHGLFEDNRAILADIRDRSAMHRIMESVRPDVVFHVAAHKHLPLLERFPIEAVRTNILGTRNVVTAAVTAGVRRLVNISTDKAARPTSVLGTTKRVAEMVVGSLGYSKSRLASARFGNVFGSRGSLLDSLLFQLERGLPVTITDPEVTRYFMTTSEAASLVIETAVMADAGETYVLDMGEPVRIVDLVERLVRLLDIATPQVEYTGLRPGEKLHEVLFDDADTCGRTKHPRIDVMSARLPPRIDLLDQVEKLDELVTLGDNDRVLAELRQLLPADVWTQGSLSVSA